MRAGRSSSRASCPGCHAAIRACRRLAFNARHTKSHSPRTFASPRGEIRCLKYEQRAATTSLARRGILLRVAGPRLLPLATGGGLVFGGDVNGRFRALDHETGEVLWEVNLGSPVTGFPITFGAATPPAVRRPAVDGRQYVAASTGSSISSTVHLGLTPELRPSSGNTLFVFALPGSNPDRPPDR